MTGLTSSLLTSRELDGQYTVHDAEHQHGHDERQGEHVEAVGEEWALPFRASPHSLAPAREPECIHGPGGDLPSISQAPLARL